MLEKGDRIKSLIKPYLNRYGNVVGIDGKYVFVKHDWFKGNRSIEYLREEIKLVKKLLPF
jgi:hypothetical protein